MSYVCVCVCVCVSGSHAGSFRDPACSAGGRGGPGGPGGSNGTGRQAGRSNHPGPKQDPHCGQERHPQVPSETAGISILLAIHS